MKYTLIFSLLFINTICIGQVVIEKNDNLFEFYRCWDANLNEDDPPDFKDGLLYYKILKQYGDSVVEVYHSACWCDEDVNYSQLDTCFIPAEVMYNGKTYIVKGIGYGAFYGCSKLKKIVMPNTLTYIAPMSLNFCDSLTSINIPTSLKQVYKPNWTMNPYIYDIFKQLSDKIVQ